MATTILSASAALDLRLYTLDRLAAGLADELVDADMAEALRLIRRVEMRLGWDTTGAMPRRLRLAAAGGVLQ